MATTITLRSAVDRSNKRKSKNLILRPAFQWKYTLMIVVAVFLVTALIGTELFGVLYQQARSRVLAVPSSNPGEIRLALIGSALAFSAVPALAFGIWCVFFTHRICGPLLVMEGCLCKLIEGRFPKRRRLRKRDEFKDFYMIFWRAINAIKSRKRSDLKRYKEILKIAQAVEPGNDSACREALMHITEQVRSLREEAECALAASSEDAPLVPQDSGEQKAVCDQSYA